MKPSELSTALREMADRFDAIDLGDEADLSVSGSINVFHIETREHLKALLPLTSNPKLNNEVPCIGDYASDLNITLFHEAGLLGGERKEIFVDSQAGLDALMAERSASLAPIQPATQQPVTESAGVPC